MFIQLKPRRIVSSPPPGSELHMTWFIELKRPKVSYVDLITLDLSEYDKPGGKEKLAGQLRKSIHTVGSLILLETEPKLVVGSCLASVSWHELEAMNT